MAIFRTTVLLGLLAGIFVAVGFLLGGVFGATAALAFAALFNVAAYWYSDKFVLRMYKARPLPKKEEPELHKMIDRLAEHAEIPKPRLYIVNIATPNAFATGRNPQHAAIAVTSGLLGVLNKEELEGVLAHEMAHVKNRDILISTLAATIAGAIAWIAQIAWYSAMFGGGRRGGGNMLILLPAIILAPMAAMLVQLAISRAREYGADYSGALISKKPLALAGALEKIAATVKHIPLKRGSRATAHMFIVNPFKGDMLIRLFSTHPPVAERCRRLKEMKV